MARISANVLDLRLFALFAGRFLKQIQVNCLRFHVILSGIATRLFRKISL